MLLPMRGKCRGLGDIWGRSKDPSYDAAFVTKINLNIEVVRDFFMTPCVILSGIARWTRCIVR